jgi:hypothetical protein
MNGILNLQSANMIYKQFNSKKKERFDIILEPLQAILQLSLLSFCPIGTKLHIDNNLLKIQMPNYSQGFLRWYLKDSKDDLFYLFYVCKRFPKYYGHLKNIRVYKDDINITLSRLTEDNNTSNSNNSNHREKERDNHRDNRDNKDNKDKDSRDREKDKNRNKNSQEPERNNNKNIKVKNEENSISSTLSLYDLLILLSIKGLNNLITTYSNIDKISLLHTLELYKLLLTIEDSSSSSSASASENNTNTKLRQSLNILEQTKNNQESIDSIFIKINELYTDNEYNVIYNTLMMLNNNTYTEEQVIKYINGLNMLLETTTSKINPWIHNHIVF